MIDRIAWLFAGLGWSALGFLAGVWAAATSRNVRRIADALARRPPGGSTVTTPDESPEPARPVRRTAPGRIVVLLLIVFGVGSVVFSVVQQQRIADLVESVSAQAQANAAQDAQDRELARCLSAYANRFADALEARSGASGGAQEALDQFVAGVAEVVTGAAAADPSVARAKIRDAFAEFLAKRADAKEQQRRNPYPPAPREC